MAQSLASILFVVATAAGPTNPTPCLDSNVGYSSDDAHVVDCCDKQHSQFRSELNTQHRLGISVGFNSYGRFGASSSLEIRIGLAASLSWWSYFFH